MFSIVEFPADMSCEVCPNSWLLQDNKCLWPPFNIDKEDVEVFIRRRVNPGKDWGVYNIRVLGAVATYGEALVKCKRAEEGSDLSSDPDNYGRGKRRRSLKRKLPELQDNESDEEDYDKDNSINKIVSDLPPAPSPILGHSSKVSDLPPAPSPILGHSSKYTGPTHQPERARNSSSSLPPVQTPQRKNQGQYSTAQSSGSSLLLQATQQNESQYSREQAPSSSQPLQAPELNQRQNEVLTPTAPKNDRLIKYVVRELNVVRHNQDKILEMLGLLLERNSNASSQQATMEPPKLVQQFPLHTIEEMYELEAAVADSICENELLTKWKSFGGNNLGDHTRRVLRHLFTDSLAEKFTWLGSRDKKCFSTLKISRLIVDAVVQTNGATRAQVEDIAKNWLRHAKERKDYKKKSAVATDN